MYSSLHIYWHQLPNRFGDPRTRMVPQAEVPQDREPHDSELYTDLGPGEAHTRVGPQDVGPQC